MGLPLLTRVEGRLQQVDSWQPHELSGMHLPSLAQAAHADAGQGGGCSRRIHGKTLGVIMCQRTLAEAAHAEASQGGGCKRRLLWQKLESSDMPAHTC